MKTLLLSLLCSLSFAADKGAPVEQPPAPVAQTSADDLQNLAACARMALASLTAEQIAAVAVALRHAEADIAAMRKAQAAMPAAPTVAEAKK